MAEGTVLIIEDDKDIVKMLEYNLRKEGLKTLSAQNGIEALDLAKTALPDLIILDLMLPGLDGLEVCKALKQEKKTSAISLIMLTAKSQESDKIIGLELGADDYMTKPFSPRELIARIKAVMRRGRAKDSRSDIFKTGELTVDFARIEVILRNKTVEITAKEFELLKALIHADGRVLSRDYLLNTIWGFNRAGEIETRTVDAHITTLRKKIKGEAKRIVTVKSYGYRFDKDH